MPRTHPTGRSHIWPRWLRQTGQHPRSALTPTEVESWATGLRQILSCAHFPESMAQGIQRAGAAAGSVRTSRGQSCSRVAGRASTAWSPGPIPSPCQPQTRTAQVSWGRLARSAPDTVLPQGTACAHGFLCCCCSRKCLTVRVGVGEQKGGAQVNLFGHFKPCPLNRELN